MSLMSSYRWFTFVTPITPDKEATLSFLIAYLWLASFTAYPRTPLGQRRAAARCGRPEGKMGVLLALKCKGVFQLPQAPWWMAATIPDANAPASAPAHTPAPAVHHPTPHNHTLSGSHVRHRGRGRARPRGHGGCSAQPYSAAKGRSRQCNRTSGPSCRG